MRLASLLFASALGTILAACSSSGGPGVTPDSGAGQPDAGQGVDSGKPRRDAGSPGPDGSAMEAGAIPDSGADVAVDSGPGPYPAGPYGVTVGSVIADMSWIGYVDDAADAVATTKPYVAYSLNDARLSGKHYAMINLAETLCPGCQKSAGEISAGGASVVSAGGVVIEVLETTAFAATTKADLDAWVNKYALPVTSMRDPAGTPTFDSLGGREQAYIVDLTSMKIVQIIAGDTTGLGATSGGKALAAMHTLLGK